MAASGITFLLRTGDSNFLFTDSGGGGSDTFTVFVDGVESGVIVESDDAATFETVLEAMSNIVSGDVNVSGSAGGPWTVEFTQNYAGLYPNVSIGATTGDLAVTVADAAVPLTNITTMAAGRSETLNRSMDEADATSKDSAGWHEGLPTIRNWSFDFEHALIEADAGLLDLERAHINNSEVQCLVQTPAANTYRGHGTLSNFTWEGPHDDIMTCSGTVNGSGPLTKA